MLDRARWLRLAPLALALAAAPLQACFGKFALTTKLYEFNRDSSESYIVQEILFLAFALLQIYTITGIIDVFILNLVEVITGENPLASLEPGQSTTIALDGGGRLEITRTATGFELVQTRDGAATRWSLEDRGDGLVLIDERGQVLATTERLDDGTFRVLDADGHVLAHPGRALLADADAMLRAGDRDGLLALLPAETCLVR